MTTPVDSGQDPLATIVGLLVLGLLIAAAAGTGKVLLRAVWLVSWRTRPGIHIVASAPAPAVGSSLAEPEQPGCAPTSEAQELDEVIEIEDDELDELLCDTLCPDPVDLELVAEAAGAGVVLDRAVRCVDTRLSALQDEGWIVLREMTLSGVRVERALIGPGGVIVTCARPARWTMGDVEAARLQADTLAAALGLAPGDVQAVVVLARSVEHPRHWFAASGAAAWVLGEYPLAWWLRCQPSRMSGADLATAAEGIARGERAAGAAPLWVTARGEG